MYCGFKEIKKEFNPDPETEDNPEDDPDYQNNDPIDPVELQFRVTKEGHVFCTDIINSVTGESLMGDVSSMNQEILEIASRIPECSIAYNGRVMWAENGEWAPGPKLSTEYILTPGLDYKNARVIAESPAGGTYNNLTITTQENGVIFEEGPRLFHEDSSLATQICTTKLDFSSGDFYYLGNIATKGYCYVSCSFPVGAGETISITKENDNAHSKLWFIPYKLTPISNFPFSQPYTDLDDQQLYVQKINGSYKAIRYFPTSKETADEFTCDRDGILRVSESSVSKCLLHIVINNSKLEITSDTSTYDYKDGIYLPVTKGDVVKVWITDTVSLQGSVYLGITPFVTTNNASDVLSPVANLAEKTVFNYTTVNNNRQFFLDFEDPSLLVVKRKSNVTNYNNGQTNQVLNVTNSSSYSGSNSRDVYTLLSGNIVNSGAGYISRQKGFQILI